MDVTDTLFIIPARGGSKGLPRKNILSINNKPLICYSIDAARGVTSDLNICVSTDDVEIKNIVEDYGLEVAFLRPKELSTDTASSRDVILHALTYYRENMQHHYDKVCLLQPTSPLRTADHIKQAFDLWDDDLDMVVSVKESKANPYFNLFEETSLGFLEKSKKGEWTRRQDVPVVYEYNGAIYLMNANSIVNKTIVEMEKTKKLVMEREDSFDIDDEYDFLSVKRKLEEK